MRGEWNRVLSDYAWGKCDKILKTLTKLDVIDFKLYDLTRGMLADLPSDR